MKKAIIYIRVSTDEQADKGYSMRHQEEYLRKYCEMNSIQMLEVVKEDYSAKTFIRPAFNSLLMRLKNRKIKADYLIFTKWDRFSRNAPDAYAMISTLNKIGIEPQAIEQPLDLCIPENKIMLAFYLSAPEVENDRRALNTLVGMRRARKEGRWISSAPKGYDNKMDDNGKKIIVPNQYAPILRWAFETLATGQFGVEEVRQKCAEKGFEFKKSQFYEWFKNHYLKIFAIEIFLTLGIALLVSFNVKNEEKYVSENTIKYITEKNVIPDTVEFLDTKKNKFSNYYFILKNENSFEVIHVIDFDYHRVYTSMTNIWTAQ